ncbi:arsenate reductase (glutaredoxin) [Blastopirellula sp. JC732]|uniref:Arsenate reductase (Glutaredoxin) n=1 Tax=Blastopirellula sediminis TaxID=2894196 RepID=A0A9X1MQV9_9BACT|nr:arsenate reductase (glutaredoxin) [Blastopirellula sediminis]MCC9606774.1 arsenate reductase (glutaredoxin) [Blastopirellula sediminis]MCC9629929.1 arsenate reductase (glutaredoxin) [Blastopirellula sediminis]
MSSQVTIYHNPRCQKSRQTLELLRSHGVEPKIVEYLKSPLDEKTLAKLVKQLGGDAKLLVREKDWRKLGLPQPADSEEILQTLAEHPALIERPIVVSGGKARLGRPPENVLELL